MPLHVIFASLKVTVGLTIVAAAAGGCTSPAAPARSVLLVVVDTLRADHVGSLRHGNAGTAATPAIDRWASGAVRFRRASTPAPFTLPATAALLAGVYPDRTGVVAHEPGTTLATWRGDTLGEAARRAGLRTAAVIANPWLARTTTGFDRGFDDFVRLYQPGQRARASDAAAVTDETIRILDAARGNRVFLWAHYFDPHMPYDPPPGFADGASAATSRVMRDFEAKERDLVRLYSGTGYSAREVDEARRLYEGEVRFVDREVGRLLDHLEATGRAKDTVVVLASDHGESLGEHSLYFAHELSLYEELTRVALIVRAPGVDATTRDDEVSLLDVAPTVCRLARLDCASPFDGRDLFAGDAPPRTLFAASAPRRSRGEPWPRLEVPGVEGRWTMAVSNGAKLVRIPGRHAVTSERYDLARDPFEQHPLTSGDDGAPELAVALGAWTREMNEVRPASLPPPARRQQRRDERALRSLGYLD